MTGSNERLIALDAVRALAVIAVVFFHWNKLFGGWAGVWVFFVLSGLVNTRSLLSHPHGNRRAALVDFYKRRFCRIAPLYFLIVSIGIFMLLADYRNKSDFHALLGHVPWLLTGLYNFYRMSPHYEHFEFFGHLWSLSVEEQFYVLLPFAVLFLRRTTFIRLAAGVVAIAPLLRYLVGAICAGQYWTPQQIGNAVFQFSPGHFDAFALGALIAQFERQITPTKVVELWIAAGLFLAGCLTFLAGPNSQWLHAFDLNPDGRLKEVWVYTAIDLLAVAWIAQVIIRPGWLDWAALQFIGRRSFGVYMYHLPLMWFWNRAWLRLHAPDPGGWLSLLPFFVVLLAISHLSFTCFELPLWARSTRLATAS